MAGDMDGRERARGLVELLATARRDEREAQVRQLVLVADLVDAYDTTANSTLPGAEALIPSGSDGTPLVAEFIAAELGPLLQESIPATWNLIHDVINLRERHPRLWQATLDLRLPTWQARKVAAARALARKQDRFVRVTHEGDGVSLLVARLDPETPSHCRAQ